MPLYTGNNKIALGANPFLLWNNIDKYLSNDFCFLLEGSKLTWVWKMLSLTYMERTETVVIWEARVSWQTLLIT